MHKQRGRPKKMRRKGPNEIQNNISTRRGLTHTCRNCLQRGHNKGSCSNPTHPKSKFYKVATQGRAHDVMSQDFEGPPLSKSDSMSHYVGIEAQVNVGESASQFSVATATTRVFPNIFNLSIMIILSFTINLIPILKRKKFVRRNATYQGPRFERRKLHGRIGLGLDHQGL
ncbi:hypothetical protein CDL12_07655 [Handroanthus impetiginosus]|uniref:Uncharacterized protein n=1 Tax=Handroanthus impetiginosus TaxID=429701 RepID=A0A2G9HQD8_9LAMI|nr:hypothetical protein CDL12_07655 [Handroanthus impetiginosus]